MTAVTKHSLRAWFEENARELPWRRDPRTSEGRRRLTSWVENLMAESPPGEINEALMELGAMVCTPTNPDCAGCPLAPECRARNEERQDAYPPPRRRRATVALRWVSACCVDDTGRWLLRRVDEGPVLRGLWMPPLAELAATDDPCRTAAGLVHELEPESGEIVRAVHHTITHRRIEVMPVRFAVDRLDPPSSGRRWVDPSDPGVPTSALLLKLVESL